MTDDIPKVMFEGQIHLAGIPIRTYVLADGRRIVHAGDVATFLRILQSGECGCVSPEEMEQVGSFLCGNDVDKKK